MFLIMKILFPKHLEIQAIQLMINIEIQRLDLKSLCEIINQTMNIGEYEKARESINDKILIIHNLENRFKAIWTQYQAQNLLRCQNEYFAIL